MSIELFCDNCGFYTGPWVRGDNQPGETLSGETPIVCSRCMFATIGDEHAPRMKVATYSEDYVDVKLDCGCSLQCQDCASTTVAMHWCKPEHTPGTPEYQAEGFPGVNMADPSLWPEGEVVTYPVDDPPDADPS